MTHNAARRWVGSALSADPEAPHAPIGIVPHGKPRTSVPSSRAPIPRSRKIDEALDAGSENVLLPAQRPGGRQRRGEMGVVAAGRITYLATKPLIKAMTSSLAQGFRP